MNNGIFIQHIVFQNVSKLNPVALRNVTQRFARLHRVDTCGISMGFGLHIHNLVFHGLIFRTCIVELAQIVGHHQNILGDFLVSVTLLRNHEIGVVVLEHFPIGERALVGGILAPDGGKHLLACFPGLGVLEVVYWASFPAQRVSFP